MQLKQESERDSLKVLTAWRVGDNSLVGGFEVRSFRLHFAIRMYNICPAPEREACAVSFYCKILTPCACDVIIRDFATWWAAPGPEKNLGANNYWSDSSKISLTAFHVNCWTSYYVPFSFLTQKSKK